MANGNINEKLKILCFVPKDPRSKESAYKLEFKCQDELEVKPTGRGPQGRYDHGMLKFSNSLVVFGGRKLNRESPFSESVYMLKLDTMIWTKVKQSQGPSPPIKFFRSEFSYATVKNFFENNDGSLVEGGKFDPAKQ